MLKKLIVAAALLLAAPAGADAGKFPCMRGCAESIAEQVLSAMAAHDPSGLPLADGARYSETGQQMGFHNGLWRTASKVGAYRHVFADPTSWAKGA